MFEITFAQKTCVFIMSLFLFVGCEPSEIDVEDEDKSENLTSSSELFQESIKSCSPTVNFSNLLVETSWISMDKGDREEFGACGVDDEIWMDKYNDGRFMLKCLAADGHRTELKEGVGYESNLKQYRKMVFTGKFSNLPNHGVTIAQIHNRAQGIKRPWLRLYIDSDRKFKIKSTETTPNEAKSTYTTYEGMLYTQNTDVTITIWTGIAGQEKAKIRIDYNGMRFQQNLVPSVAWENFSEYFYLKAGVYTEGEDKEAKVTYSKFDIIH